MAESVSSLSYDDFQVRVARHMGFSQTASALSGEESAYIDEIIQDGLQRFYGDNPRGWRFLNPTESIILWTDVAVVSTVTVTGAGASPTTITASEAKFHPLMVGKSMVITGVGTFVIESYTSTTVVVVTGDASTASADTFSITGGGQYTLDANWGSLEGPLTFDTENYLHEIRLTSEGEVRRLRQTGVTTGIPKLHSTRIREGTAADVGQADHRIEIFLWPIPDKDYTVSTRFNIHPPLLSTGFPYPLGGPQHNPTVRDAILARAQLVKDDISDGPMEQAYQRQLMVSLAYDARQGAAELVGKNSDESDAIEVLGYNHIVTVNGVTP